MRVRSGTVDHSGWPARDALSPPWDVYADGDIAGPQNPRMPFGFGSVRDQVVPPQEVLQKMSLRKLRTTISDDGA